MEVCLEEDKDDASNADVKIVPQPIQENEEEGDSISCSYTDSEKLKRVDAELENLTSTEKRNKLWFQPDKLPSEMQFMFKMGREDQKFEPQVAASQGAADNSKRKQRQHEKTLSIDKHIMHDS